VYEFNYVKGEGLKVQINKDDELMEDDIAYEEKREEARIENLEYIEECKNDRDFEQQEKLDSGMKESDFC